MSEALAHPPRGAARARSARALLGCAGLAATVALWWAATHVLAAEGSPMRLFAPEAAWASLPGLIRDEHLFTHAGVSLMRVATGLGIALALGVPVGLLVGRVRWIDAALSPTFQFLRMISPLSWMPIAVMSFGIGERAIGFLLAFAAFWPIVMSTASGVAQIDARWLNLGASLAATRGELLRHIVLPAIAALLDARDRLAYSELAAVIVVIGAIGFALDTLARAVQAGPRRRGRG